MRSLRSSLAMGHSLSGHWYLNKCKTSKLPTILSPLAPLRGDGLRKREVRRAKFEVAVFQPSNFTLLTSPQPPHPQPFSPAKTGGDGSQSVMCRHSHNRVVQRLPMDNGEPPACLQLKILSCPDFDVDWITQMKRMALLLMVFAFPTLATADELGELIFADDFERSESQELKDEPGNGWGTNSQRRAKGNKQVDLRDGAMHIFIHEVADHGVSVTHPAGFTDGAVALRFLLEDPRDSLGLNFADLDYKPVHAGHLFVVRVNKDQVHIQDLKTGNMDLKIREARLAGKLSPGQQEMLKGKSLKVSHRIAPERVASAAR